jgi:hypothetical protein
MKKTAINELVDLLNKEIKKVSLGGITYYGLLQAKKLAEAMLDDERKQIESAYDNAKNYPSADTNGSKYYFMTYINND